MVAEEGEGREDLRYDNPDCARVDSVLLEFVPNDKLILIEEVSQRQAVLDKNFSMARLNGEAIPVVMTVTVNFSLQNK